MSATPAAIWWILLLLALTPVYVKALTGEEELFEYLMANNTDSRRMIPPPVSVTTVTAQYQVRSLISVNEQDQKMETFGWVVMMWQDSRLSWSPADHHGITFLTIPSNKVWLPVLGFRNSMESDALATFDKGRSVTLMADGTVRWYPGGPIETSCELDLTYFPFDKQVCSLRMISWDLDTSRLLLKCTNPKVGERFFEQNNQWDLVHTACKEDILTFDGISASRVQFHLYLNRKPLFYLMNVFLPCTILALLSVSIFFIPPGSIAKLSIGFTLFLNFTVFLLRVSNVTPRDSDRNPVLSIFISTVMVVAAMSILASLILNNIHQYGFSGPVPACLRAVVFQCLARLVCMKTNPTGKKNKKENTGGTEGGENNFGVDARGTGKESEEFSTIPDQSQLSIILEKLEKIEKGKEEKEDADEENLKEWRQLVVVIERVLGLILTIGLILLTLVLLVVIPNSQPPWHPEI